MKIIVNGEKQELNLIDSNGINWVQDFIGNWGALSNGEFNRVEGSDEYECDADTFAWWSAAIEREQANEDRIAELKDEHGSDVVNEVVANAASGYNDLEDIQLHIAAALDEVFGVPAGN